MSRPDTEREIAAAQAMIHGRLKSLSVIGPEAMAVAHLDEDATSAFVEGVLDENEARSIIKHLVTCVSCREFTARLIRLEPTFLADAESSIADESPNRLRRFFEELASQVIPSGEDTVFAYHTPDEKVDSSAETTPEKPKTE
jgi:hypothetical protein